MKLSEAFFEYRRIEIQSRGCSLKTDESVKYAERVVVRYFGDVNIRKIGTKQISEFYLDLTTNNLKKYGQIRVVSQNTARNYVMILRAVIRFCYKKGVRTVNPSEVIVPKREKKYAHYIDTSQYYRLIAEVSRPKRGYAKINRVRNELIIKMLFYTGLRIGELCALNRDSIRDREFTVVGKSKDPRLCFITKDLEQDIHNYLEMRHDDSAALFVANENGRRINPGNVQRIFRLAAKKAKLSKVTPHTMRHSFATRMLEEGVDIRYVAELLGHQDLNTTKRYTHVKDCQLKRIYENVMEMG